MSSGCSIEAESRFGPPVDASCLGGFDFTLLFEETILTILPATVAILWATLRLFLLRGRAVKVRGPLSLGIKLCAYAILAVLQATLLAVWTSRAYPQTPTTVAALVLGFVAPVVLALTSRYEHSKTIKPSTFLTLYLGISALLEIARVRTLYFMPLGPAIPSINTAAYLIKVIILGLELSGKRRLVRSRWQDAAPEATASVYSRALFLWINRLLLKGARSLLTINTLVSIDAKLLAASKPSSLLCKWQNTSKDKGYALLLVFVQHYKWSLLAGVIPRLCYLGLTFAQPFLIEEALDYVALSDAARSSNVAYGLIAAYAIVYIGMAVTLTVYQHKTYRVQTEFRGSLVSLIYDKTLKMNQSASFKAEAITLMSADVDRIGMGMHIIHESYAILIEIGLAIWLLYRLVGVSVAAVASWFAFILILGVPLAHAAGNGQLPWLEAIETRLTTTTALLSNIKSIRMMGLGRSFSSKVSQLRRGEIRASRRYRLLTALTRATAFLPGSFAPVWCFGVYILIANAHSGETLTPSTAFAALSLINLLDQPSNTFLHAMEDVQILYNSFKRVQEYLLSAEQHDVRVITSGSGTSLGSTKTLSDLDESKSVAIAAIDAEKEEALRISSVGLQQGVAVSVQNATMIYPKSQKPILDNISLEANNGATTMIIGPVGCGKTTLLKSIVGEGPNISGTISSAFSQAAYCPQTAWITPGTIRDNIVGRTAWDTEWYNTVLQACSLVQDLEELPDNDKTLCGSRGSRLSGGQQKRVSLARALYSRNKLCVLDSILAGLDNTTEQQVLNSVFGSQGIFKRMATTVIVATSSTSHLQYADHVIVLDSKGTVTYSGKPHQAIDIDQRFGSDTASVATDPSVKTDGASAEDSEEDEEPAEETPLDDTSRQTGDLRVYAYYLRTAGIWMLILYVGVACVYIFGQLFPPIWLQWWTNNNLIHPNQDVGYWLGIYGGLSSTIVIGSLASEALFMLVIVPRTSAKFHEYLLTTTMRATTAYLSTTDLGEITNRFSQDLELIDNDLPESFDSFTLNLLSVIASTALVFTGSSYIAAIIPALATILYLVQSYYLRTSRQLRLLDIEAKAPLFSHFLETLRGLSSIRAYGWTNDYQTRHLEALNNSQKPYYLLWCIQRWLALVLDLIGAGLAILLVGLATGLPSGQTGFLGVALFNIVGFSSDMQGLVTEWTQLETAIGAVNRIRSYVSSVPLEEDDSSRDADSAADWPPSGDISFRNVTASYDPDEEAILKDMTFNIHAGEKVAICGRTGSGKSSLISTLLRTMDLTAGSITIGGDNVSLVSREHVRECLNTVTQDAVILNGALRDVLDPDGLHADELLLECLCAVNLDGLPDAEDGLSTEVTEEGLSHGQMQLLCLARALVKGGQIVLMDEVTSNIDHETDAIVQDVIRKQFKTQTIVAVAHKLDTILDFDKVLVLEGGRLVESGKPQELLDTPNSKFAELYRGE